MTGLQPLSLAALLADKPGEGGVARVSVTDRVWRAVALGCRDGLHDLLGLWVDRNCVHMALADCERRLLAIAALKLGRGEYPSVGQFHAPALRLERTLRDLKGVTPLDLPDTRAWIDHGVWPAPPPGHRHWQSPEKQYAFLTADGGGEGLHQIAVGPVHAGIIEPGHFRFTANGEAVVRLEERLGYVHKGIEALATGANLDQGARLAARISGDSTVAYSYAFALAAEQATGITPPRRAVLIRAIMAELERVSHHVNDVGAICNDASVVALHARATIIREDMLQTQVRCFGHRLMMDKIVPGGVATDLSPEGAAEIEALLRRVETGFGQIVRVYDEAPSLQDRTVTTGILKPELARRFAAGGFVGRGSGRAFDTRAIFPYPPYDELSFRPALRSEGDVNARVWIRIDEVRSSFDLIRQLLKLLEPGPTHNPVPPTEGQGFALVESFRGDVLVALRMDSEARVAGFHARDPSCFQWPLLEAAVEGNIVADFPLCNKSFNCSYSGHDM
ncbi:MAG: hydrogenase expression protein HypE [Rhizobiales bacterium]|nr:hydrogenase expression protein HypE [Hyphomicrobiales bacterium]MBI3674703.1 hydrogenase expression protein HypE [Hyphomicrobiales bacterium]